MGVVFAAPYGTDLIGLIAKEAVSLGRAKDLSGVTVLFTHKRPKVYLYKELKKHLSPPFIPPRVLTMGELVEELFSKCQDRKRRLIDQNEQLWLLYQVVRGLKGPFSDLDLKRFLPWGRHLLGLFDEVELGLLDGLENMEYVEGEKLLRDILGYLDDIYRAYRNKLDEMGFVTASLRQRMVAEKIGDLDIGGDFIVSGFYALTRSESKILKAIFDRGGIFFWEVKGEELPRLYQERWIGEWGVKPRFLKAPVRETKISIYSAPDLHSEAEKVKELVPKSVSDPTEVAVIVPSPSNLLPIVLALPEDSDINITAGYPLSKTGFYSLLELSFRLFRESPSPGTYPVKNLLHIIRHPFVELSFLDGDKRLSEHLEVALGKRFKGAFIGKGNLEGILKKALEDVGKRHLYEASKHYLEDILGFLGGLESSQTIFDLSKVLDDILARLLDRLPETEEFLLEREAAIRVKAELLPRIRGLVFSREVLEGESLRSLFLSLLSRLRIPFEGEPLSGIQVMGVLEARLLKFRKVIVVDVNEGVLPSYEEVNPLLPDHIKRAIGLSDRERREEIVRYYFERLILSSDEAYLLYQENVTSRGASEDKRVRSRFIERLIWERERREGVILGDGAVGIVEFPIKPSLRRREGIPKDGKAQKAVEKLIKERGSGDGLSYSLLDTYVTCPVMFYYRYILGLQDPTSRDDVDGGEIGTLVHRILEAYFREFKGRTFVLKKELLHKLIKDMVEELDPISSIPWRKSLYEKVISFRLERYLNSIPEGTKIVGVEEEVLGRLGDYVFYGRIDRIDERREGLTLVDHKTGSSIGQIDLRRLSIPKDLSREALWEFKRSFPSLQLPIYAYLYAQEKGLDPDGIQAFYAQLGEPGEFEKPVVKNGSLKDVLKKLPEAVDFVISHILNSEYFYFPEPKKEICRYCGFREICDFYA